MQNFMDLQVWEKSHLLAVDIYSLTKSFPKEELYGLTSQIRRSAYSIPANIAEGCGRNSKADFARFLSISFGSACELEYFLILVKDLNFINENDYQKINQSVIEVKRMLSSFIKKLKTDH